MKKDIHPEYYPEATVICGSCGATWKTGPPKKKSVQSCSNFHPFYTGQQQRILDVKVRWIASINVCRSAGIH